MACLLYIFLAPRHTYLIPVMILVFVYSAAHSMLDSVLEIALLNWSGQCFTRKKDKRP
jgi:hypothetical protein